MSEPRKNHLSIDGGQVKEDEHVSSYKPIPEADTEFRTSKNNLTKSKEKISPDGAEEKLLPKEEEAKIVTRVDMADAKYVVEDHRNGDAKIELDANKRQFSGLSKEELMKYADDPFWVNLRWFMFILFWAMWLGMLAAAITIIVKAPKCPLPTPKTWFQEGPLVDMHEANYDEIRPSLELMQTSRVKGIFIDVPTYEYSVPTVIEEFKKFVAEAAEKGIKVVVDLIPNYVSIDHEWFQKSVNNNDSYADYFVWNASTEYDEDHSLKPPTVWRSTLNTPAWTYNADRKQFYLHHYSDSQPDLNFYNEAVKKEFDTAIQSWLKAGAAGVRLNKARQLLVVRSLPAESILVGKGSSPGALHTDYVFWSHAHTSDLPQIDELLARWATVVNTASETPSETVFTLEEAEERTELFLLHNVTLRPPMSRALLTQHNVTALAADINKRLHYWPAMQLKTDSDGSELALFALLLPAAPVFEVHQLHTEANDTDTEHLSHLSQLRSDATVQHGEHDVLGVPAGDSDENTLIACARWKTGKSGYVAVYNPQAVEQRANLTRVASLPPTLSVHHMSYATKTYTNLTSSSSENVEDILVPPLSTVVLSYVPPKPAVEK